MARYSTRENKSRMWNRIHRRDSLFRRKIYLKVYHTRVPDQPLTKPYFLENSASKEKTLFRIFNLFFHLENNLLSIVHSFKYTRPQV